MLLKADAAASEDLFKPVKHRLVAEGFGEDIIGEIFSRPGVSFKPEGVSTFFVYRERSLNYDQFTKPVYINKAAAFVKQHKNAFEFCRSEYGVSDNIIASILLVETKLGDYVGRLSTLNTLATMAALEKAPARTRLWKYLGARYKISRKWFEKKAKRRSRWAYKELNAFLTYCFTENIPPETVKGSFAGAIGICQFMPTSIIAFAKDGNHDGRVDLFDPADAIASVAFYLKKAGWKKGLSNKKAERVIFRYNRSRPYVSSVMKIAALLERRSNGP